MNPIAIWKGIQMLSAMLGLVRGLLQMVKEYQEAQEAKRREKANKQMQEATTAQEVQNANEAITRNLP